MSQDSFTHEIDRESTASSLHEGIQDSQAPDLQRSTSVRSLIQSMSVWFAFNARLAGSVVCFALSAFMIYGAYMSRNQMHSWIVQFWVLIAVLIPSITGANYLYTYLKQDSAYLKISGVEDSNAAIICTVEVCINNETVLTVRSWWPMRMSKSQVEKNGVRVAMSSANRWLTDNSQPGGKVIRVRFDEQSATQICKEYICTVPHVGEHNQCSVCLEDIESQSSCAMSKCGHVFHQECLSSWFTQSSKLACPMCRCDHHSCVPQSVYMQYIIKEEPSVSVLTVNTEEGTLA